MQKQQNTIQEEAIRRYDALPDELKQAMSSVASAETIYGIGKKFGLNVEETGNLASLIGYTILGMVPIAKFVDSAKDVTGADSLKAAEIAREVNAKIFLAIREQLKKTHGEKWDERFMREQPRTAMPSEQPRTAPTPPPVAPAPMAPKSPWEIRPDGFRREIRDQRLETSEKSVIPPVSQQPNNLQPTTKAMEAEVKKPPLVPEEPKTRETPQPAPAPRAPEILKEIRPIGLHEQPRTAIDTNKREQRDEQARTAPIQQQKPETPKAAPPSDLPFMKEVGKLIQTPELEKPAAPKQPETQQLPQPQREVMPQSPQPVMAPKPPVPQEVPQQKPSTTQPTTPPEARLATGGNNPQPTAQKYALDPYREPIE